MAAGNGNGNWYDQNNGGAQNGAANTGGGGGGLHPCGNSGKTGGSGVCIIRVPTARYSGTTSGSPQVSTSGTDTILRFTGNGSYTA